MIRKLWNNLIGISQVFEHHPIDLQGWQDEEEIQSQMRLEEKRQKAREWLGKRWIVHPENIRQKLDVPLNSLGKSA